MMTNKAFATLVIGLTACFLSLVPATAWESRTETTIVTTAARILSREGGIPLTNLEKDIRRGASISEAELVALVPGVESDLTQAILSQFNLLQSTRGTRVDPYLAYRLGILGKLVARLTSPMLGAAPAVRDAYHADVDKNIQSIALKTSPRRVVDLGAYLSEVATKARARQELISRDYEQGTGFAGVARGALSEDASRAVDAVADVWNTLLKSSSTTAGVSDEQRREYSLSSLGFYLERGNPEEAKRAYEAILDTGEPSADLRKRIGDLYYEAGKYDRAMDEYKKVRELEPGRDDVAQRIAEYYARVGEEAVAAGNLEAAVESFQQGQTADPQLEIKRRQTQALIEERNARLEQAQQSLIQAQGLMAQVDQEQVKRNFGAALDYLNQAKALFAAIPSEFKRESQQASAGLTQVDVKSRELKAQLISSTDQLSGSGFDVEARRLAASGSSAVAKDAFGKLVTRGYEQQVATMKQRAQAKLAEESAAEK